MNIENKFYLFYDKYSTGDHSFSNKLVEGVDIKNLYDQYYGLDGFHYQGDNAVEFFNKKFFEDMLSLPIEIDNNFITFEIFTYDDKGINYVFTIVKLDIKYLEQYYKQFNKIPNEDFIKKAIAYHMNYKINEYEVNAIPSQVIKSVVDKVIVPKDDIMDPIIDHPKFIVDKYNLFDYQRRTIRHMLDIEKSNNEIYFTRSNINFSLGDINYDPISKKFTKYDEQEKIRFRGGALIDEVGLGKTIQTLTLCLLNPAPSNQPYINPESGLINSRATLVICPNQLCGQWKREISKMINDKSINVVNILTKTHFDKVTYQEVIDADFVIVSYNFIGNEAFTSKYRLRLPNGANETKTYYKSKYFNLEDVNKVFNKISDEKKTNPLTLLDTEPILPIIHWHRLVVDEFHEAFTVDKFKYVGKIIPAFKGTYKWIISGTPFDKGTECFISMLDYASDYTNKDGSDIIISKEIKNFMTEKFFRRNTRKSTVNEVELPKLTEKIIWCKFSATERMMYNSFLSDPNMDKYSEKLRQICCHPKLADDIKGILNNCKTLEEIQDTMVSHHEKNYKDAVAKVIQATKSLKKTERRILITEYIIQRKFLKQLGHDVYIDLPNFEYDDEGGMNLDDDEENVKASKSKSNKLFVINEDSQNEIHKLIGNKLKKNESMTLETHYQTKKEQEARIRNLTRIADGKKNTMTFFNNMLESIQKAVDKAKEKYERANRKDKGLDSDSDSESDSDIDSDSDSDSDYGDDEDNCPICMCEISGEDVGVTKCGHHFCHECLATHVKQHGKCPVCQVPQKKTDIMMISFEKPVFDPTSKILKTKMDMINKVGTKLTNLIYYLNSIDNHVIIFSQWDNLLNKVGTVLDEYGINNVFCKGNVWTRDKAIREFNANDDIKVIMLSSESAASGTNLTKASKVILLDPVSGDYEYRRNTEWQAVGRSYRMGQLNPVEIIRFVIKDTIEEEIYKDNKEEDKKQKTQLNIYETADDTITLTEDKITKLSESVEKFKKQIEEKRNERMRRKKAREDKKLLAQK